MSFEDWRDADASLVAQLYDCEWQRWNDELGWDTRASWAIVEDGRARGHVPGWILREASGTISGWTYYVLHQGELQIGGLTARRAVDLRRLLDRVLDSPEASLASSVSCFVFPAPASLTSALSRRRFSVRRSLYLTRALCPGDPVLPDGPGTMDDDAPVERPDAMRVRPFVDRDMLSAVRLLAAAYDGEPGGVCFAPHGRLDEWVRYVRQLMETPACGHFLAAASLVAEDIATGRLTGLVLCTSLAPATAHVAQLVVGRQARRQGVGERLLRRATDAARGEGFCAITLMVDEGNAPAVSLYTRHGFRPSSAFAFGRRRGQVRQRPPAGEARRLAG